MTSPASPEPAPHPARSALGSRAKIFAWAPSTDTLIACGTLLVFWGCYWAGSTWNSWFLFFGILLVGTFIPALTVFRWRKEGWAGLGITRKLLLPALIVAAVLGAGSLYQLITVAAAQQVELLPHLLANLLVLWEPLFVFGWLYLRWERAFGWLPAIVLTGLGFALQHVGSVPLSMALGFGMFAVVFAIAFAFVKNLAILWPLFYPIASSIGTAQAGIVMGWDEVLSGVLLLAAQVIILVFVARKYGSKTLTADPIAG